MVPREKRVGSRGAEIARGGARTLVHRSSWRPGPGGRWLGIGAVRRESHQTDREPKYRAFG
jgi:hypothetical protein